MSLEPFRLEVQSWIPADSFLNGIHVKRIFYEPWKHGQRLEDNALIFFVDQTECIFP